MVIYHLKCHYFTVIAYVRGGYAREDEPQALLASLNIFSGCSTEGYSHFQQTQLYHWPSILFACLI